MASKVALADTGEIVELTGVHPVADLFPMLEGEDLDELAASMAKDGQDTPVVIDQDRVLLDGRNRLAACEKAGVVPTARYYDGDDAEDYAYRVNDLRRHQSNGARAVVAAKRARLKGLSTRQAVKGSPDLERQPNRVNEANVVLDWAPDMVPGILAGEALSTAYDEARKRKQAATELEAKKSWLREGAPDLAALVDEEQITIPDACAALEAREKEADRQKRADEEEERRRQRVATHLLCEHLVAVAQTYRTNAADYYNPGDVLPGRAVTRQVITDARSAVDQLAKTWKERNLP